MFSNYSYYLFGFESFTFNLKLIKLCTQSGCDLINRSLTVDAVVFILLLIIILKVLFCL
jgi:hypothetical protein